MKAPVVYETTGAFFVWEPLNFEIEAGMSSLRMLEKVVFEKLFDRGGYVLNFKDKTYKEYFNEYGIDIEYQKYRRYGTSKMKRLRAFWEIEDDKNGRQTFEWAFKLC